MNTAADADRGRRPARRAKTTAPRRPSTIPPGSELVTCIDGPHSGAWFYLADWKASRSAALHCGGDPLTSVVLGYVGTSRTVQHPHEPDKGRALTYSPSSPLAG